MVTKATAKPKVTQEAYEKALQGYAKSANEARTLAIDRDKELAPIMEKYDPKLKKLETEMDEQFDTVMRYCQENRKIMFVGVKSIEEMGVKLSFRDGNEKVVINEGFKEKEIVVVMEKSKKWKEFLRYTPALDKDKIIEEKPKGIDKLGLQVKKEETFSLKPIHTEVEA